MPRPPCSLLPLAVFLSACAPAEVVCPDPIGPIVHDDCEAYAERYGAMLARLGDGGETSGGPNLGRLGPREPSRLIKSEIGRILALCRDFNTCGLTQDDYRSRREALDRTLTSMLAIAQQLAQPGLDDEQRSRLVQRLEALTVAPAALRDDGDDDDDEGDDVARFGGALRRPGRSAPAKAAKPAQKRAALPPWFDAQISPPVPPPAERDLPRLVWPWGEPVLRNVMEEVDQQYTDASGRVWQRHKAVVGYRPQLTIMLWGRAAADDGLELRFENGAKSFCPVGRSRSGVFPVVCEPPPELALTGRQFEVEVRYRQAISDIPVRIGALRYDVTRYDEPQPSGAPIHTYYLDWDRRRAAGWVYFAPVPSAAAPAYEQLHLHTTIRLGRVKPRARLRCLVSGERVVDDVAPGPGSASTGWMQHQPKKVRTPEGVEQPNPDAYLHWWHFDFPLPFALSPRGGVLPAGLKAWPHRQGPWQCLVSLDDKPVRELSFLVHRDGMIEALDEQAGKSGQLAHPWFLVQTKILPNSVEALRSGH